MKTKKKGIVMGIFNWKQPIRFISYFLYAVLVGYLMLWGASIQQKLKHLTATTFNNVPQFTFMMVFPVFIGILLALPGFIAIARSNGHWKVDWAKLFGIGLPALYVTIYPFLYFVVPRLVGDTMIYSKLMISGLLINNTLHTVGGLVLGYLIPSAIHKEKSE
ncbi:MAG: hypothetical protein VR67_00525 [Peptococcaceae bacterium BRH_c8a]|nr:MAG: hypothetical protein VR67_00525 [Peptococcaceae bacterium BRH_c8a]